MHSGQMGYGDMLRVNTIVADMSSVAMYKPMSSMDDGECRVNLVSEHSITGLLVFN